MGKIIHCRGAHYPPLRNPCQQKHTFFETRPFYYLFLLLVYYALFISRQKNNQQANWLFKACSGSFCFCAFEHNLAEFLARRT